VSEHHRRELKRGLVSALVIVVALRIVPSAAVAALQYQREVQARATSLVLTRGLLEATPAIRDSLGAALGLIVGLAPHLVTGQSQADAAATLGSLLSARAIQGALRVRRMESLADSGRSQPRLVLVRAELEGDVHGLARFLSGVESGEPLLSIREVTVTALDPAAPSEVLRLEVVVGGLYWARSE